MLKASLEHIVKLVHHSLTPWLHFLIAMLQEDTTVTAMTVVAEQVKVIATIIVRLRLHSFKQIVLIIEQMGLRRARGTVLIDF